MKDIINNILNNYKINLINIKNKTIKESKYFNKLINKIYVINLVLSSKLLFL